MTTPIPKDKKSEFLTLLNTTIEERKEQYSDKLNVLNLSSPLLSYMSISFINDFISTNPSITNDLPTWLKDFLLECFKDTYNYFSKNLITNSL